MLALIENMGLGKVFGGVLGKVVGGGGAIRCALRDGEAGGVFQAAFKLFLIELIGAIFGTAPVVDPAAAAASLCWGKAGAAVDPAAAAADFCCWGKAGLFFSITSSLTFIESIELLKKRETKKHCDCV